MSLEVYKELNRVFSLSPKNQSDMTRRLRLAQALDHHVAWMETWQHSRGMARTDSGEFAPAFLTSSHIARARLFLSGAAFCCLHFLFLCHCDLWCHCDGLLSTSQSMLTPSTVPPFSSVHPVPTWSPGHSPEVSHWVGTKSLTSLPLGYDWLVFPSLASLHSSMWSKMSLQEHQHPE